MQKITQWGEYGVHTILHIAYCQNEGKKLVTALEISESQNISLNYTQQILMKLRQGKLIESERGPKGGFHLAKAPEDITLKEILHISEGETMELICEAHPLDHPRCSKEVKCYLRSVWYGLKDVINNYLDNITLRDLLDDLLQNPLPETLVSLPTNAPVPNLS